MLRTTVNLPDALHHHLYFLARGRQTTVSDVVRQLVEKALKEERAEHIRRSYEALNAIKGIIKGGREDISGHIDDILYGEQGAWKGRDE
jgi:Arc/MetJ-type ribon-helix-helix transcriptional regulator